MRLWTAAAGHATRAADHATLRRASRSTGHRDQRLIPAAVKCRMTRSGSLCSWVTLFLFGCSLLANTAAARPLVMAPPTLASQVAQPCVLYACPSNPAPHTNWENTLGTLPADYCSLYTCSPMDLISDNGFDDNLFPLNPDWAYFAQTGHPPDADQLCQGFTGSLPCTTDPVTYDNAGVDTLAYAFCPFGRSPYFGSFHGHINWEPATYQGNLVWEGKADEFTDDDYSFDLLTVGGHGVTAGNSPGAIHIEFDSDETVDHFDSSPWWAHFHHIVDNGYGAGAPNGSQPGGNPPHHQFAVRSGALRAHQAGVEDYINGDFAVVTGLIGLDTAHTPAAESHPVYAVAIQNDRQQALAGGTDRWAIFARNFGNEGFCSQHDHPLSAGPITIRIPWQSRPSRLAGLGPRPATGVTITNANDLWSNMTPSGRISILPGQGVLLTFDLSRPSDQQLYWGTIDLQWTWNSLPPPSAFQALPPLAPGANSSPRAGANDSTDVEAIIHRLWKHLPAAVRARVLGAVAQQRPRLVSRRLPIAVAGPPEAPLRSVGSFVLPSTDAAHVTLGRAEKTAICAAFKGRIPGHPAMCAVRLGR